MAESRWDFWNDPCYDPQTKLSPIFWDDFMVAAWTILENQKRRIANPLDKDPDKHRELEIYDVFDWMRQQLHDELPYTPKRCAAIDAEIEKEFIKDAAKRRAANQTTR